MSSLADVALLSGLRSSTRFVHACCHIWTIAQLALLMLVVGIVSGVWATSEMVIVANDIVVRTGHSATQP